MFDYSYTLFDTGLFKLECLLFFL